MVKLTPRQQRFVDEYLIDLNGTQAAIRAGYSHRSAAEQSARLLAKVSIAHAVAAAMAARSARTGVTQDRVVRELARIAFVDPTAVVDFQTGTVRNGLTEDDRAVLAGVCFWSEGMIKTTWLMAVIGVVGILGCIFWTPFETRYECLFKAGTPYTEIAQNWNVVEQRGDIWVVTEKAGTKEPAD